MDPTFEETPLPHRAFYVWNPQGAAPKFKHKTYEAAITEAERLANANPNDSFFVLEARGGFLKPPKIKRVFSID